MESPLHPQSLEGSPQATASPSAKSWLDGYCPLPGALDECVARDGSIRPAWRGALEMWSAAADEEHQTRRQAADRYLRDNGVAHRVYGADHSTERPWPLSHLPLIIDTAEWAFLEKGLIQRANLLEQVVADLYGAQKLVSDGHIPASVVAGAPGFLRPLVGSRPRNAHHLHYIAVELGRGPDGKWWVLGDRTQAPSGAGYALENRLATSRAMSQEVRQLQVRRLAGFFQALREAFGQMTRASSARVGLLTPGPFNESYYEQAFLARYLGFLLLEGGDLVVRDNAVFVRTVRGLKRLDVLWRRLDAAFCDPLELRSDSHLGVAGLVQAAREGGLTCVNALGAGLLESRAFMAFMPALAKTVLGEPLAIPNIATWWLGDEAACKRAKSSAAPTIISSAYGTSLPMDSSTTALDQEGALLPADQVAQEVVRLSTMPTLNSDPTGPKLVPKPFSLRVFLARTPDGWTVMPGGFCRVADTQDTRALSLRDGSRSADVWVRSDTPVKPVTLLPRPGATQIRRVPGTLPSRAADNLFWLGRYTERAQLSIRLVRAYLARRLDGLASDDPLVRSMQKELGNWGIEEPASPTVFDDAVMPNLLLAHGTASVIRDRFSPDAWQTLSHFVGRASSGEFDHLSTVEKLDKALAMLAAFAGLIGENMIRLSGWRFLEIGRRLERASGTCQLTRQFAYEAPSPGAFDLLLEIADSVMSYRQRYTVTTDRQTVCDLILLDPNNPRSVSFQLERIHIHVNEITDHRAFDQQTSLQRLAFNSWSRLHTATADTVTSEMLNAVSADLAALSNMVSADFMASAIADSTITL